MDNAQFNINFDINTNITYSIDLNDSSLLGSSDAAFEDFDLLESFSIEKRDCTEYLDETRPFMVLCAHKGTGKTTLNRLWNNKLNHKRNHISLIKFDTDISPDISENNSPEIWVKSWKANILYAIFLHITEGKTCGIKEDDFKINHLHMRQRKKKNFIDLLLENISDRRILGPDFLLPKKNSKIWVFLDEIDQYFSNTDREKLKMSSLLIACRELTSSIENLYIRTTMKPNVWAVLSSKIPAMANMRELIVDYQWSIYDIRAMIAKRISSYLQRTNHINSNLLGKEDWLIGLLFDPKSDFDLSSKSAEKRAEQRIPPYKIIAQLGIFRPRWAIALCKQAMKVAATSNNKLINVQHIKQCMPAYGKDRIDDIASEFSSQCEQIDKMCYAFFKAKCNYSNTQKLIAQIDTCIVHKFPVKIAGISDRCNANQILRFLYEKGFVQPKSWISKQKYQFLDFENNPLLIDDNIECDNIMEELVWEIHPAFRNALSTDRTPHAKIFKQDKSSINGSSKGIGTNKRKTKK
ncbi:P-loop ATPase, Sll1717 family [Parabacteroides goldsteinii]|uniref:P-loop ATPase, Sll1717 family n=1 Tax=Parabacteroides goldsteinii TaxID=328812 RepID=UPI001DEBB134|nr:hypothetical protein [Parabacteroides goldsteinii]MBS6574785.1 hypothetical protein [Parabacteroides goldsteinii]